MTGDRENNLLAAANLLLDARRTGDRLTKLPAELRPTNAEEIDAIQDALAQAYGEIGGWKIGAANLQATPSFAPMPAAWIAPSGSLLSGNRWRYRGLEAEIAFLVGEDLPPRATPYSREEVLAAMGSCHPAIEVLETAFADPVDGANPSVLADLQRNGGFIYGAGTSVSSHRLVGSQSY
jgi:2-keto-4-pentenoate hydratase